MHFPHVLKRVLVSLALLALVAAPAAAQIEDQISAYTGKNARGYLQPLADAFGADLNSGIFRTGHIKKMGPSVRLELQIMSVLFGDDDRTFRAVTEQGFSPEQYREAPTVVGSVKAVSVENEVGTSYAFPGGFDLNSFALAVPQLRVGAVFGTEAIVRYFSIKLGDDDLGDLGFWGFGLRHSISQYLGPVFPVDLAAGFLWQKLTLGENEQGDHLISSSAFSMGVQASRKFAKVLVPYAGLSYDTHSMDVSYEREDDDLKTTIDVDFEKTSMLHLTIGLMLDVPVLSMFAEYNIAGQSSFVLGIGLGY